MIELNQGERIVALEIQLKNLATQMETHIKATEERHESMSVKLDDLLGLRNKGIGAFWVMASLTGTGIISLLMAVIGWFKGHVG